MQIEGLHEQEIQVYIYIFKETVGSIDVVLAAQKDKREKENNRK